MSDLDRLIASDVNTWLPRAVPDFAQVQRRKRAQDRRRRSVAAGGALVVASCALVAQATLPSDLERLPAFAASDDDDSAVVYTLKYEDAAAYDPAVDEAAVQRCLRLEGVTDVSPVYSFPPQYGATIEREANKKRFAECAAGLPNIRVSTAEVEPATESGRLVAAGVVGAAVCYDERSQCASVLEAEPARRLADAINGAPPASRATYGCPYEVDPQFVRATFMHADGSASTVRAGLACLTMQSDNRQVRAASDNVKESLRQYAEQDDAQRGDQAG